MATPPTVVITQSRGGAAPGIFRLGGGINVSSILTGTFGTNQAAITDVNRANANDTVEFKGNLYTINTDGTTSIVIRKRVPGTGIISDVHTFAGANFQPQSRTGLYVVNTGSGPYLCAVNSDGSNNVVLFRTTDGASWSNVTMSTNTSQGIFSNYGIRAYRGLLLIPSNTSDKALWIVNVATGSLTFVADPRPAASYGSCVCVFKNRVFMWITTSFVTPGVLAELSGSSLIVRSTPANPMGNASDLNVGLLQAIGDTKMILLFLDADGFANVNIGWRAFDVMVSGATFNLVEKNTLVPAGLRKTTGAFSDKYRYAFWSFIDNETDPAAPKVFIWYASDDTGAIQYCEYIDSDSELLPSTTGVTPANFAFVAGQGAGDYINTSDGDFFIDDVTIAQGSVPGRALITFKAYGGGSADKFVRGYFSSMENPLLTQMTLIGVATGGSATRNGNQIEQVQANGATTYSFEWAASADGQSNGAPERIVLVLATT